MAGEYLRAGTSPKARKPLTESSQWLSGKLTALALVGDVFFVHGKALRLKRQ